MIETFDEGLRRIGGDYKVWLEFDRNRSAAAKVRKELSKLSAAAQSFRAILMASSEQTKATLRAVLAERTGISALSQEEECVRLADRFREAADDAKSRIPKRYSGSTRPFMADKLRELFDTHARPFTAYASDAHGGVSPAVECLMQLAADAGDDLSPEAARKLIERAIAVGK